MKTFIRFSFVVGFTLTLALAGSPAIAQNFWWGAMNNAPANPAAPADQLWSLNANWSLGAPQLSGDLVLGPIRYGAYYPPANGSRSILVNNQIGMSFSSITLGVMPTFGGSPNINEAVAGTNGITLTGPISAPYVIPGTTSFNLPITLSGSAGLVNMGYNAGLTANNALVFGGAITDGGANIGLTKTGPLGAISLKGTNTYGGATTLREGRLYLDYSTNATSKLANAAALNLHGGQVDFGNATSGNYTEVVGSTDLASGYGNAFVRYTNTGSAVLRLNAIAPNTGAVDFQRSGSLGNTISTTNTNNATGILGYWATVTDTGAGTDWATNSGSNEGGGPNQFIAAYSGYTNLNAVGPASTTIPNTAADYRINAAGSGVGNIYQSVPTVNINSLVQKHNVQTTVDMNLNSVMQTSAIMLGHGRSQLNVGSYRDGGTVMAQTAGGNLQLTNYANSEVLHINSTIRDNATASSLTKTGKFEDMTGSLFPNSGIVTLHGHNTYTGQTLVTAGVLSATPGIGLPTASNLKLNGGVLRVGSAGSFDLFRTGGTGAGQMQIDGNGGFGSSGTSRVGFGTDLYNAGANTLTWGSANFNPNELMLGNSTTFVNPIALGSQTRVINAFTGNPRLSGLLTGTGTIYKVGSGTLFLDNFQNSFTGMPKFTGGGAVSVAVIPNAGVNSPLGANAATGAGSMQLEGGALTYTGINATTNRGFSTINNGSISVNVLANTQLWMGDVSIGPSQAPGISVPTANSTLKVGNVFINGGGDNGGASFNADTNATFVVGSVSGNADYDRTSYGAFSGGVLKLQGAGLGIVNGAISIGDTLNPNAVMLNASGGRWILRGASTFTGPIILQGTGTSTLQVTSLANAGAPSPIGAFATAGAGGMLFNVNSTFQYTGPAATTNRGFTMNVGEIQFDFTGTTAYPGLGAIGRTLTMGNVAWSSGTNGDLRVFSTVGGYAARNRLSIGNLTLGAGGDRIGRDGDSLNLTVGSVTAGSNLAYFYGGSQSFDAANVPLADSRLTGAISSSIANGTKAVEIVGPQMWTFSGTNTYGGDTYLTGGTFRAAEGAGLSSSSNLLFQGGVYEASANFARVGGTLGGQMQMTGGTTGFGANGANIQVAFGTIGAPTALTWGTAPFAPSTLVLNTTTSTGKIEFLNAINLNAAQRAVNVIANNTTNLMWINEYTATMSGLLTGGTTSGLSKQGNGILILSNPNNSYTGVTTVGGGFLSVDTLADYGTNSSIGTGANLGTAGSLVLGSGRLRYTGGNVTINRGFTASAGSIDVSNAATTLIMTGAGAGPSGFFLKFGPGTLELRGAQVWTGLTTMNNGKLRIDATSAVNMGVTPMTFSGTSTFQYDNVTAIAARNVSLGILNFAAGDGTIQSTRSAAQIVSVAYSSFGTRTAGATGNYVLDGASGNGTAGVDNFIRLTGAAAGFFTTGGQGLFFGGADYAYMNAASPSFVRAPVYGTDATFTTVNTVAGGTHVKLTATPANQNNISLNTLNLSGTPNFTLNGGQTLTLTLGGLLKGGTGTSVISGGLGVTPGSGTELVVRVDQSGDTLDIQTPILANGSNILTKSGAGNLILSAANTHTGNTFLNAGTLTLKHQNALQFSNLTRASTSFNSGSIAFDGGGFGSAFTVGGLDGTFDVNLTDFGTFGAVTLSLGGNNASPGAYSGVLSGTNGAITKIGTGTQIFTGRNTYTGKTLVGAGILRADDGLGLPTASNLELNGGVFQTQGTNLARVAGTGAGQMQITGGISGFSSSTGKAQVAFGTIASPAAVQWGSATFNPSQFVVGANTEFMSAIDLNGSTRSFSGQGGSVSGVISDSVGGAGLNHSGSGNLILANANNSYTGATTIGGAASGTITVSSFSNAGVNSPLGAYPTAGPGGFDFSGGNPGGNLTYTGFDAVTNRGFTQSGYGSTINLPAGVTLQMGDCSFSASQPWFQMNGSPSSVLHLGNVNITGGGNGGAYFMSNGPWLIVDSFSGSILNNNPLQIRPAAANTTLTVLGNIALGGTSQIRLNETSTANTTVEFKGNSTYTGQTFVNANTTLVISEVKNVGVASPIGAYATNSAAGLKLADGNSGAVLRYLGPSASTNRGFNASGNATINIASSNTDLAFTGEIIVDGGSTLTVTGGTGSTLSLGTLTFSNKDSNANYIGNSIPVTIASVLFPNTGRNGSLGANGSMPVTVTGNSFVQNSGQTPSGAFRTTSNGAAILNLNTITAETNAGAAGGGGGNQTVNLDAFSSTTQGVAQTSPSTIVVNGTISETTASNALSLTINPIESGIVTLLGTNTYRGTTTISKGALRAVDGVGLPNTLSVGGGSNLSITGGGVFETGTNFSRTAGTTQGLLNITNGGFSAYSATSALGTPVTFNVASGGTLTWGSTVGFSPTTLILNPASANNKLIFTTAVDLNGAVRTVQVSSNVGRTATMSGQLTGNASSVLTKTGTGALVLSADNSPYAGGFDIKAGILQVANANALGAGTADIKWTSSTGALQYTSSNTVDISTRVKNSTAAMGVDTNGQSVTWASTLPSTNSAGLTKLGAGTLTLSGATNAFTGVTTAAGGVLKLDYTSDTTKLHDTSALTLSGGTVELANGTHNENIASTTLTQGRASAITRTSGSATLQLKVFTRNVGSTINISADDVATTTTANVNGILGTAAQMGWATVGGTDWAMNSGVAGVGGSHIRAYTAYTNVAGGANIPNNNAQNMRLQTAVGGNYGLAVATTETNTIMMSDAANAATINTATGTLRTRAVLLGAGKKSLTIGTAPNSGILQGTAGGNELIFNNQSTAGELLTVNAQITDNSTTPVTITGSGTVVFTGANTYTGETHVVGNLRVNNPTGNLAGTGSGTGTGTLRVYGGGTLGGSGAIGGNVILSAGLRDFDAGAIDLRDASVNTLSIGGNLTMGGSYSLFNLDYSTTSFDRVSVNGIVTVNNGGVRLNLNQLNPANAGTYTFLSYNPTSSIFPTTGFGAGGNFFTFDGVNTSQQLGSKLYSISNDNTLGLGRITVTDTVTATTYNLTANAVASPTVIVGGTTTFNSVVTNTGTGGADTLNYNGLNAGASSGTVTGGPSGAGGPVNNASNPPNFATQSLTYNSTGATPGTVTLTPSVASATNANLGGSATLGTTTTASVTVLDHSNGSFNSAVIDTNNLPLNLGTVITGGPTQTQNFSVFNLSGSNIAGLNRGTVTPSGPNTAQLTTDLTSVIFTNLPAGNSQAYSASMTSGTVGLLSAIYTAAVGDRTDLPGNTLNATPLSLSLAGTVLDHSNGNFGPVTGAATATFGLNSLLLDFGTVVQGAGGGALDSFFDVFNVINTPGLTAAMDLDTNVDSTGSGNIAELFRQSGNVTFANLAASLPGSGQPYTFRLDTNTAGVFSASYQFLLSDQNLPGATAPNSEVLTLNLIGTVAAVPEPSTLALGLFGLAGLGLFIYRQRRRAA